MLIALTGATGFIGRYIARHLIHHGHNCRCWYREGSDRSGLEDLAANLQWSAGELGERAACQSLVRGCDAVVHAVLDHPEGRFREGQGDLLEFVRRNVLGTLELIETARASGVRRFVLISSCAVHDKILDDRPLDETHPMWPTSHYGAHKAALEEFVYSYGLGHGYEISPCVPAAYMDWRTGPRTANGSIWSRRSCRDSRSPAKAGAKKCMPPMWPRLSIYYCQLRT